MSRIANKKPTCVLVLGSGGLRIGQAGEFDYSGSQALKILRRESVRSVLINPNIATVQTDEGMADVVYSVPLQMDTVVEVIKKEHPDAIFLGFGGQTALNLGLELHRAGVLKRYDIRVLGTAIDGIEKTEDRALFKEVVAACGAETPRSFAVSTVDAAVRAADKIGYPVMMRAGFSLGGLGSGKITNKKELRQKVIAVLRTVPQVLIEEYLLGWKEFEYEVVRDGADNAIVVCAMENMDPMGIHTGESIVVAPTQTLTNGEYQSLRDIAIAVARRVGIVGECNIQFALHPQTGECRVIEMNARLSRSSALASKATGYPLAAVAAQIALGFDLPEIKNVVTQKTTAFFEPALDYVVVKIPRWDMVKFRGMDRRIGSQMKSVGEVMGIGRTFPEALQKAIRMLNIGAHGLTDHPFTFDHVEKEMKEPTDRRLFAIADFFSRGGTVRRAHALTRIDPWFLHHLKQIANCHRRIKRTDLTSTFLREIKQMGFGDKTIAAIKGKSEQLVRQLRLRHGVVPSVKRIDTVAGEFPTDTNYLYTTYHGQTHDVVPLSQSAQLIVGSGPYCIGSSVEFDWCAVNLSRAFRAYKKKTIIVNSNPETVSTDYDESDRLYFEELTQERVQDIADFEQRPGIVVSVGGQIANTLALPLAHAGYRLLGTQATDIDRAENRQTFSSLLRKLGIRQPQWKQITGAKAALAFAKKIGYPIIARPSYVLAGGAMRILNSEQEFHDYIHDVLPHFAVPIVVSAFIREAKEFEIDAVARRGKLVEQVLTEHVEYAGVHSGDATIVYPAFDLSKKCVGSAHRIAAQIAKALHITGPMNIQFLEKDGDVMVIECNVRSSRSFPFVSKVNGTHLILATAQVLLGHAHIQKQADQSHRIVGVKTPQFSYQRLGGVDPVAHVEMASTGEVACVGKTLQEAFFQSWLSANQYPAIKQIVINMHTPQDEELVRPLIRRLVVSGWKVSSLTMRQKPLRVLEEKESAVRIMEGAVGLVIDIPCDQASRHYRRHLLLRRLCVDHHVPIVTDIHVAMMLLASLVATKQKQFPKVMPLYRVR